MKTKNADKRLDTMKYTAEQLSAMPESILLKYTLIDYEMKHPDEKPESAIALIVGLSAAAIDKYKNGMGFLSRSAWRAIYNVTRFELIREWDSANRIGGAQ